MAPRGQFLVAILAAIFTNIRGQATPFDCPDNWISNGDQCYLFVSYPSLPYVEASNSCQNYGADLVSVNTAEEHQFIVSWLIRYKSSNHWYTSGVMRRDSQHRQWVGDGNSIAAEDVYWAIDPATEGQVAESFTEAHLIYQFSEKGNGYGWAWSSRSPSLSYICEVSRDHVYRVHQQSRDFSYGSTSSDPADWLIGPKFLYLSRGVVFTASTKNVVLDCQASGQPSPTYTWYTHYGTEHETAIQPSARHTLTSGRMTILDPDENIDTGEYTCVAENSVGKVFSKPVRVAAGFLNEFSNTVPGYRTANLYTGAALECNPPSHSPALKYLWIKNNNQNIRPEQNKHTFVSENGNLYFSEVQMPDEAKYFCIVDLVAPPGMEMASTERAGTSKGIELKIQGEDPNDFGPEVHDDFPAVYPPLPRRGETLHVECMAYGRLPLTYSWSRVDGLPMAMQRISFSNQNRVMQVRDARLEDSGVYMCTVEGTSNTDSKNITIQVEAIPFFMLPLRDQHLDKGSQLTWVCDAVAIPQATYHWYKNGQLLTAQNAADDIQVSRNVLTINSADEEKHNGMYECVATNNNGQESTIAQVRVLNFAPTFAKSPVRSRVMGAIGGNLTVTCRPEAAPYPVVTWTRNGAALGGSGRIQVLKNGDLALSGLTNGDGGTYTCVAENNLGRAESSTTLSIVEQTTLFRTPGYVKVMQNSTAHLPCEASYAEDKTDLVYVWYFNDHMLDIENEPDLNIAVEAGVHGLYVVGAQFDREGYYECRATTVYDSVSAKGILTVLGPPGEPGFVHVNKQTGTEVTLWWQAGVSHGDAVTFYRIYYSSHLRSEWKILVESLPADKTQVSSHVYWRQYNISANTLSPGTSYTFKVSAASGTFGFGEISEQSPSITLDDAAPIYPPRFVSGGGGSVGMLRIKWEPLPPEDHGGKGLYYLVYWRLHRNPDDMWTVSKKINGNLPVDRDGFLWYHQLVGRQMFYLEYDVKVQAVNNMGHGPNSTEVTIMSAEDVPVSTPQNVYTEGINATAAWIHWDLPNNTREGVRGKVLGYQLNWWPWGEDNQRDIIHFVRHYGEDRVGMIIGLKGNKDYWVDVQVFNSAGLSRPSGRAYLNPNYDPPHHYPDYVIVQSHGPDSASVSWRGVSTTQDQAPVSGYLVWYWPATDNIRTAKAVQFGKVFSGVITGLEKDKLYKLRVMATSDGGIGKKSPSTYFTLGGQVRFNPRTSEIMASASNLKPSILLIICVGVVSSRWL